MVVGLGERLISEKLIQKNSHTSAEKSQSVSQKNKTNLKTLSEKNQTNLQKKQLRDFKTKKIQ